MEGEGMEGDGHTPKFGFAIDHRKCIGCHACTVACKAENDVPLAKFRTWVKYVEKGSFPAVKRHFTVLRCNHCDNAPCVEICPVNALQKRPDAIVDLDRDQCVGCRACFQACPYDALYMNEDTGVAEKCHYCAHRTEVGLEPACVVVCPERAIVPGDTTDPDSEISQIIRDLPTLRRKLEKGTQPRVWYVDALPESLVPGSTVEPTAYLWSERQSQPPPVPVGFEPPPDIMTTFDVSHPPVWGWHIWAYLVTKNLAAGAMLLAPLLPVLGRDAGWPALVPEAVALTFLGITLVLLVADLGRPERFLKLLLTPNPRSWLVKGAWVLSGFGALTAASLVLRHLGFGAAADVVRYANLPFAVMTAGYSAFLFRQCRGRDLWIESGLFTRLILRAGLLGAALGVALSQRPDRALVVAALYVLFAAGLMVSEYRPRKRTDDGAKAHAILEESGAPRVGMLCVLAGGLAALAGAAFGGTAALVLGSAALLLALAGEFVHEKGWIEAGQAVPNS